MSLKKVTLASFILLGLTACATNSNSGNAANTPAKQNITSKDTKATTQTQTQTQTTNTTQAQPQSTNTEQTNSTTPEQTLPKIVTNVQKLQADSVSDAQYQKGAEALVVKSGKLAFNTPKEVITTVNIRDDNTDTGMRILKLFPNAIDAGHGSVKFFENATSGIYLRNNETNGWNYQSFGRYYQKDVSQYGFISIGEATKEMPTAGTATFKGIAMGDGELDGQRVVGSGEIVSNAELQADFASKTLTFKTTDSKGFDDRNNTIQDYANFNLSGNAKWDAGSSQFKGSVTSKAGASGEFKGSFYGPKAEEVGGTFSIVSDTQSLKGGFGAKQSQ